MGEFLDLIGVEPEPSTDVIVAHLEHCMSSNAPVHDFTYQMLSERLEREDDLDSIDRLDGTDFIYFPEVGFIGANDVFWTAPAFGEYWHAASPRMGQREQLYRRLGVADAPTPRHFAMLAIKITGAGALSDSDIAIHGRCLAALAEALERDDVGAMEAVELLQDEAAFLNVAGQATWTGDAIWLDSEQLAEPFGAELDDRLVRLTDVARPAAVRFLAQLGVVALTEIARFRLAEEPDGSLAEDATSLLRARADLVLWLAPNRATRDALRSILERLEIRFSRQLLVQAEIDAFDPPVRSPASTTPAYWDQDTGILHMRSNTDRVDWVAAFRALFAQVDHHCPSTEIPPLCLTGAYIMSLGDRDEVEQALRTSDFQPPAGSEGSIEFGRELEDEPIVEEIAEEEDAKTHDASDEIVADAAVGEDEDNSEPAEQHSEPSTEPAENTDDHDTSDNSDDGSVNTEESDEPAPEDEEEGGDEVYGSASGGAPFGADDSDTSTADQTGRTTGARGSAGTSGGFRSSTGSGSQTNGSGRTEAAAREVRRSRMLAYVSRSGTRVESDATSASGADNTTELIDAAAMKAALAYEEARGWKPERQPHFNPGFDIVSRSAGGDRRLIEVKGLENEWTERGIKLSHVQFSMAREHPGEFWIYIVEHARDLERQVVTAIANPFGKVDEYWFDHNWRELSEEKASSREIHLKVGLKVEHHFWKKGKIVEIKSRGAIPFVVVDFGRIEGRRGLPFNSELKIIE